MSSVSDALKAVMLAIRDGTPQSVEAAVRQAVAAVPGSTRDDAMRVWREVFAAEERVAAANPVAWAARMLWTCGEGETPASRGPQVSLAGRRW